jgi:hypothetical protein
LPTLTAPASLISVISLARVPRRLGNSSSSLDGGDRLESFAGSGALLLRYLRPNVTLPSASGRREMLASSETSLSLLYTHVHVHVHVHVHYARVHFLYSVSGCASGCSSFLVIFFLARRGYSLLCLSLTSHPHIRTSTHPTHSATSRNFPQPHTTSHNLPQPPTTSHNLTFAPPSHTPSSVVHHPSTKSRGHAVWHVPVQDIALTTKSHGGSGGFDTHDPLQE